MNFNKLKGSPYNQEILKKFANIYKSFIVSITNKNFEFLKKYHPRFLYKKINIYNQYFYSKIF